MFRLTCHILLAILILVQSSSLYGISETLFRRDDAIKAKLQKSHNPPEFNDEEIVERLLTTYQRANAKKETLGNSMWQDIFNSHHKKFHHIFMQNKKKLASQILRNPRNSELFIGIDSLRKSTNDAFKKPGAGGRYAKICLDSLIRFAESIGAIRLDNPELHHLPPVPLTANKVIQQVEKRLGFELIFPNPFRDEYGAATNRGVLGYRVPQSLYQAWKIKELLKGIENPRVLEIGGGLGRTAYYARLFGIKDYTIIDIPFTSLLAGYFLSRTLGDEHILLSGETAPDSDERIKLLSPIDFIVNEEEYDLILNADSLTEMDPEVAQAYWNEIEKRTPLFISINHEQNPFTVRKWTRNNPKIKRVNRAPYWMRPGYVEEIIDFYR